MSSRLHSEFLDLSVLRVVQEMITNAFLTATKTKSLKLSSKDHEKQKCRAEIGQAYGKMMGAPLVRASLLACVAGIGVQSQFPIVIQRGFCMP